MWVKESPISIHKLYGTWKISYQISNHISLTTDRGQTNSNQMRSLASANKTDKAPKSKVQSGVTESEVHAYTWYHVLIQHFNVYIIKVLYLNSFEHKTVDLLHLQYHCLEETKPEPNNHHPFYKLFLYKPEIKILQKRIQKVKNTFHVCLYLVLERLLWKQNAQYKEVPFLLQTVLLGCDLQS